MKNLIGILLVTLILPGLALAEAVDETRPADADGVVVISVFSGDVTVVGWDRSEVQVTGDVTGGMRELDFFSKNGRTVIETEAIEDGNVEITVNVPAGSEVRGETLSASFAASGLSGIVTFESISGAIELEGDFPEVSLATVSGSITVSGGRLDRADIGSISGKVSIHSDPPSGARWEVGTVSGPVELHLPPGAGARIDVETFSGSIDNALGPPAEKSSSYVPAQELHFTLGGGGATIMAETVSGSIRIIEE